MSSSRKSRYFFRGRVSLFGSDEILLNYASILRDERNYTMVSCLGRKNRAGGQCFGERDRGREEGVGEIWKRESVPHFSRLDPPSCLLRVWDIFLFLSLSGTGNDKSDEYFNRIMYSVGHSRNIYVMGEAIHSHP